MDGRSVAAAIEEVYRTDSRRILASLIRLLGDMDLAEEALHEAFAAAVERWAAEGIPDSPRAWLVSAGRFRAIDHVRRRAAFDARAMDVAREIESRAEASVAGDNDIGDDRLRLIFTCCHPALDEGARIALTLRTVCGLSTEEIAHAFLVPVPTLAQRIVRAKGKIRAARIPYDVPALADLSDRLDAVLRVVYLIFNEGYSTSLGDSAVRTDLCDEAIRLARLIGQLLPHSEVAGLLALLLLQDSRRAARVSREGEIILLEEQDRSLWNREAIAEGVALVEARLRAGHVGPYLIQAAIAAVHAESTSSETTDWEDIVGLYDVLMRVAPSPVVALNRAVAVSMLRGPDAGLTLVEEAMRDGTLDSYHLAHSARGEMFVRLGRLDEARASYEQALALVTQAPEKRLLARRLTELRPRPSTESSPV